ncbi:MAG TPA: TraB/GumN family protein [Methanocorpusculum sp.]|nr:TraB/GumN family protein [Methanocorpusculum sp.]
MTQIHIVGTAHVSEKSIREVREAVDAYNPEIIAIELDPGRYAAIRQQMREEEAARKAAEEAAEQIVQPEGSCTLTVEADEGNTYVQSATVSDVRQESVRPLNVPEAAGVSVPQPGTKAPEVKKLLSGNFTITLVQWLLAYVQRKIGFNVGVEPGAEMKEAIRLAEERHIRLALIDRDINITLSRFWKSMKFLEKAKLVWALVRSIASKEDETDAIDAETVDSLTQENVLEVALDEFREFSPTGSNALITERDAYLAHGIIAIEQAPFEHAVVVCGAGHVPGITRFREHPETLPAIEDLRTIPKKFPWGKVISGLVILVLLILVLAIGFSGATELLLVALIFWVSINAVLAGIGVIAARGHILSALTAAGLAWLTSLSPFLACGWFAALVEARMRPPTAGDIKAITKAESLKQMASVPLFRILLVAALANVGSILGTVCFFVFLTPVLGVSVDMMKDILLTGLSNLWNWIISPFVH